MHIVIMIHKDQYVCICSKGVYICQFTTILVGQIAVRLINHDEILSIHMAQCI